MSEKFDFSLMPLGIGSAFFYVIVKADENIAWPFPDAESLAAELNAREAKLAEVEGERDRAKQEAQDNYEANHKTSLELLAARSTVSSLTAERDRLRAAAKEAESKILSILGTVSGMVKPQCDEAFMACWQDMSDIKKFLTTALSAKGEINE